MILKNVKLEIGIDETDNGLKTITDIFDIEITGNKISKINKHINDNGFNCNNFLMIPALSDNHIHLDKGHYGSDWQTVIPMNSVKDRIKEEKSFLKEYESYIFPRGQALINLICGYGATFLKVHVNIDPIIKIDYVKKVKSLLENNANILDYKIVAFPQHGFLKSKTIIKKALDMELVDEIGGVDPATIDFNIEKTLDETFLLAAYYGKNIDIHLHDPGTLGLYEIERILYYTKKYNYKNKVQISHAFALNSLNDNELKLFAKKFINLGIKLNTTVPLGQAFNFVTLMNYGVTINIVNDNINDHWSAFGTGDLVERASRGAEYFSQSDEWGLNRVLKTITRNNITPLDDNGNKVWPNVGDKADFILINASCSSEVIARIPKERIIFKNGVIIK